METLSRYLYATGPIEMANQLCEMKIERDNQLLFKRGELTRVVDERTREKGKPFPPINCIIYVLEADIQYSNFIKFIGKMIDGKYKEEEWKKEGTEQEVSDFWKLEKTSAQEAADVRLCSIDQLLTKSIQEQNRKVCEKVPAEKASQIIRMKIDTISKIIIKRAEVTKAVDKALREGKSVDDAIGSYSNETTILCNTFLDAASKMLKESGKRKKEEYFMVPIRARTQYAFVRALLSVEAAFHGELDQPFYPQKEISKNQLFIYKDVRGRVGDYEKMMRVEDRKTRKQVEKLLRDDPKARVEPLLFEYQQFLFELVEKAKKEGLEWKNKWDDAALKKEAEIKEKVTVEKEKEGEKEEKALEKKEEVLSKDEMKVENEKVMEEEVPTKQIAELKSMMTVMKEEMLQEFNKKLESTQEKHEKEIEEIQKDYCRLEKESAERNEEVKRLTAVVESLNKKLEAMTMEMAEKQKETENELEGVKKELKEVKEDLEKINEEDSEEDSSFDQLDDSDN